MDAVGCNGVLMSGSTSRTTMVHEIITQIIRRGILHVIVIATCWQKEVSKQFLCNCN